MQHPAWAERIFENEFNPPSDRDAEKEAQQWLDDFVVGDSFEEFYDRQVRDAPETKYSPGSNRAYSIIEPPFNCEGQATVGALAGELVFNRDLELVVDWNLGEHRSKPHRRNRFEQSQVFNGHVALQDEDGNIYGDTSLMDDPQVRSPKIAAGIYLTNMADEAAYNDKLMEQDHYLAQIDPEVSSQYAGARRRMIESKS